MSKEYPSRKEDKQGKGKAIKKEARSRISNMSRTQQMKSTSMLPKSSPMPQHKLPGQHTSNPMAF